MVHLDGQEYHYIHGGTRLYFLAIACPKIMHCETKWRQTWWTHGLFCHNRASREHVSLCLLLHQRAPRSHSLHLKHKLFNVKPVEYPRGGRGQCPNLELFGWIFLKFVKQTCVISRVHRKIYVNLKCRAAIFAMDITRNNEII